MRFPPLKALRSFEAAARHLSFSKAAEELFVTPAAVSHQVKALEDWLGVILFKRLNRAVILTNEGQNYVMGVRNGLEIIGAARKNYASRCLRRSTCGYTTVIRSPVAAAASQPLSGGASGHRRAVIRIGPFDGF